MRSDCIPVKDGEFLNRTNAQTAYTTGRAAERGINATQASESGALGKFRCG